MEFKKKIKLFLSVFIFGILLAYPTERADAATEYSALNMTTGVVKSGNYYFKYSNYDSSIEISNMNNGIYYKTPIENNAFSNGKQAYYFRDNILYKYVYSSRKETKIKSFEKIQNAWDMYYIRTIYGSRIIITKEWVSDGRMYTYTYNIKTKKCEKIKNDCDIIQRSGKYVIADKEIDSSDALHTQVLYKITANGLSKIKTLTKHGAYACFIGKKVYYVDYPSKDIKNKATLYKCHLDGTNQNKIATFETDDKDEFIVVSSISSDKCEISLYSGEESYEYTYATQEYKK
jgi:hypothetical protein